MGKTHTHEVDLAAWHRAITDRRAQVIDAGSRAIAFAIDESYHLLAGFALESGDMTARLSFELKFDFTEGQQRILLSAAPVIPDNARFTCVEKIK